MAMLASIIEKIDVPETERIERQAPAVAKKPAVSEAKKADPKKPDSKKPEPKKPDPLKTEPARWWVQVAQGATASTLGRDWNRVAAKAPAAFRGKAAWTVAVRASNRLLAGPFKGQSDAQAFITALAKEDVSAFAWQSEAGQKIEKLGTK